nr:Niemann-Pick type C2 Protein [Neoseiulus womersleyi]
MEYLVLFCLLAAAAASTVRYRKCPSPLDGYVEVNRIAIKGEIRLASKIKVDADAKILQEIPKGSKMSLRIDRVVNFLGQHHIKIPCIQNVGSCTHDVCDLLALSGTSSNHFNYCAFWPKDKPCACPDALKPQVFNTTDTEVDIPTLGPIANLLGTGHYVVKAHLLDANNTPFFCVDIDMNIE